MLEDMDTFDGELEDGCEAEARFAEDVAVTVTSLAYRYFSKPNPMPGLTVSANLDEVEMRDQLVAQQHFECDCVTMFEQVCDNVYEFAGDAEAPPGRKLIYEKIEWRSFSPEALEEEALAICEELKITDPEKQKVVCADHLRDGVFQQYYEDFQILLHKALKKLALEYFPEIKDMSATGLRETEFALYLDMIEFYEHVLAVVEDEIDLNLDESMYPTR